MANHVINVNELSIDTTFLSSPSELYHVFAPIKTTEVKNQKKLKTFFEENGGECDFDKKELAKLRFFYFAVLGYTKEYNLYWFLSEVSAADKIGLISSHTLMYFAQDSLSIDKFLLEFFELFPQKRFSAPIKESMGTLKDLVSDAAAWYSTFFDLYLEESSFFLAKIKKSPKRVDNN